MQKSPPILRRLFKTTSFRLTLIFVGMFVIFAGLLIGFLSWSAKKSYFEEIQTNINTEVIGLAEAYRAGRLPFLIRAANGRGARPDAPIILVIDRNGTKLAGNITNIDPKFFNLTKPTIMPYRRTVIEMSDFRNDGRRANNGKRRGQVNDEVISDDDQEELAENEQLKRVAPAPLLSFRITRNNRQNRPVNAQSPSSSIEEVDEDDEEIDVQKRQALVQVFGARNGIRVLVGRDIQGAEFFDNVLARALIIAGIMALAMGLVGGVYISYKVLARVEGVSVTANQIMAGDLSERMPIKGNGDEFDRLSTSLNNMLDRLELLMQGMKQVSDNIAHDLKTPLTRMRTRIETSLAQGAGDEERRNALETALDDADQLISTFNALLHIARLEAGNTSLKMEALDFSFIAQDVLELYEPSAEDAGLPLKIEIEQGLTLYGNRELIAQAISNILDNAIKYGALGDEATQKDIIVQAKKEAGMIYFSIADRGIGIPQQEHERVLERFVRLEKSRTSPGNGLGLSLVRAIISIHKGDIILSDHKPGLKVMFTFPALTDIRLRT